jgi:hypothetical protein
MIKWTSIIAKQCPNDTDHMKRNFDECIRDYLEAVAKFPNIGNQLICWLCTAKKPALMPMHEFTLHQVQLLSYLKGDYLHQTMDVTTVQENSEQMFFFVQPEVHKNKFGEYLHQTMDVPTAQEKSEQIFFMQPKAHQNKFADLNKMVPTNLLRMIVFFEQHQATNKAAGILKIAKYKKQPKERKTAHLPAARSHESSYHYHHSHKCCNYPIKVTKAIATITDLTIVIERINTMIVVD